MPRAQSVYPNEMGVLYAARTILLARYFGPPLLAMMLWSSSSAQGFMSFQRIDGPAEPIVKMALEGLQVLDDEVAVRAEGDRLDVHLRTGHSPEVVIQTLRTATGARFRTMMDRMAAEGPEPGNSAVYLGNLGVQEPASLFPPEDLLARYGAPARVHTGNAERDAAVFKEAMLQWMATHPEEHKSLVTEWKAQHEPVQGTK